MKNYSKYFLAAMCVGAMALSTGTFLKVHANTSSAVVAGQPVDLTYAADKSLPAVVYIKYVQNSKVQTVNVESDPFSDFFGDPFGFFGNPRGGQGGTQKRQVQTPKREASGSGVIISPDGYIVTNNHVVEGADQLTVTLNDNREYNARIIGTDKNSDLALIKIDGKNLPAIQIGNSDDLKVGEWVLAVGNPFNLNNTVTAGIVSAKARSLGANGVESFIQTDAAINSGNSGGALVNTRGELVGINAMLYSQTGSYSGYGFAIPTTIMTKVVEDLKKYGTVQRAVLGIMGANVLDWKDKQKEEGKELDLGTNEGIYVSKVESNSAGEAAGLKEGDVIVAVDGKKVTLKNAQGNTSIVKSADLDVLGGNFRTVTEQQKNELKIAYGLEVIKVNDGALKKAGIGKGLIILDVNDTPMKSLSDLQNAVKSASTAKDPVLYIKGVWPTGKKDYFAIQIGQ